MKNAKLTVAHDHVMFRGRAHAQKCSVVSGSRPGVGQPDCNKHDQDYVITHAKSCLINQVSTPINYINILIVHFQHDTL
jgi:hypothetical protein